MAAVFRPSTSTVLVVLSTEYSEVLSTNKNTIPCTGQAFTCGTKHCPKSSPLVRVDAYLYRYYSYRVCEHCKALTRVCLSCLGIISQVSSFPFQSPKKKTAGCGQGQGSQQHQPLIPSTSSPLTRAFVKGRVSNIKSTKTAIPLRLNAERCWKLNVGRTPETHQGGFFSFARRAGFATRSVFLLLLKSALAMEKLRSSSCQW
jgi:hypothetical protein